MTISLDNPIGVLIVGVIIVLVATGLAYGVLEFILVKIILGLMHVPEEERSKHTLNKLAIIIALLVLVAGVVMVILPILDIDTGPLNLLRVLGYI